MHACAERADMKASVSAPIEVAKWGDYALIRAVIEGRQAQAMLMRACGRAAVQQPFMAWLQAIERELRARGLAAAPE